MNNPFEAEISALSEHIISILSSDPETKDELVQLVLADLPTVEAEAVKAAPKGNSGIIRSVIDKRSYNTQFRRKHFPNREGFKTPSSKVSIFISYRRSDAIDIARLIADHLSRTKKFKVAYDLDALRTGEFARDLGSLISKCDVFLPIYTPDYFSRVDDPEDWVRREVETALHLGKTVCPVLVDDTPLPKADKLPEEIRAIIDWNAYHLYRRHMNHCLNELGTKWLEAEHMKKHNRSKLL